MILLTGYILFVLIGLVLGLIGGGGSILSVPVLVYLLGYSPAEATAYSLFIVGVTSLVGTYGHVVRGNFSLEALVYFALPSLATIFLVRRYLMPALPDVLLQLGSWPVKKDMLIMLAFAVLMVSSSWLMIRKVKRHSREEVNRDEFSRSPLHFPYVVALGMLVGLISGVVGAGGGFIIIPILVLIIRVPMKRAIGTSLAMIALNCLIGFAGNIGRQSLNWKFLLIVSAMAVAGLFIGLYITNFVSGKKLKPLFGWFTLLTGSAIVLKELFF